MPILKFWNTRGPITLDNFRLEDITNDKRTTLLDKKTFFREEFRVDKNIYMVLNDMFFKLSKIFNKSNIPINAMLIRESDKHIIIVPSRSYVFWNGRSVEPVEYSILGNKIDMNKLL